MRCLIDNQTKRVARPLPSILSIVAIAIAAISSVHAQQSDQSGKSDEHTSLYEITINETTPLLAHVRGKLSAARYIEMNTNCPNYYYPEGWASFVRNLTVTANGSQVPIEYVSKSKWELDLASPRTVTVEYDVDLSFTTMQMKALS